MYGVLVNYKHREGHCDVPQNYVTEDYDGGTKKLGGWLHQQRQSYRKGTLDETKKNRLQDLGVMWVLQTSWEEMLLLLLQYKEREGHGNVPQRHVEEHENLGKWLSNQRTLKKQGTLDPARRRRLEEIGVVWKINDASRRTPVGWEIMS